MIHMNLLIKTMFLAAALSNLRNIEPNVDRQRRLAETLKNPEKLAKTELRIELLTACRKNDLIPRFIEDAVRPVRHIFSANAKIVTRTVNFAKVLLNEAIAETFRTKAFLVRQRSRLFESLSSFLDEDRYLHISTTCARVYDITIHDNRPRLVKKFLGLKATNKDKEVGGENDMDKQTMQKRVKNLSSLELPESGLALLAKGPNFATTQTVSKAVLLQVEKGVERFAYAKRWKDKISENRENQSPVILRLGHSSQPHPRREHRQSQLRTLLIHNVDGGQRRQEEAQHEEGTEGRQQIGGTGPLRTLLAGRRAEMTAKKMKNMEVMCLRYRSGSQT